MKKYFIKYGKTYFGKDYNSFTNAQYRACSFPADKPIASIEYFRFTAQQKILECRDEAVKSMNKHKQTTHKTKSELLDIKKECYRLKKLHDKFSKTKIVLEEIEIEFFKTNITLTAITWTKPTYSGSKCACAMCGVWLEDTKYLKIVHALSSVYFCPFCIEILGAQAPQIIEDINDEICYLYKTNKFVKDL